MERILPVLLSLLLLTGCGGNSADGYQQITQEEAKEMMDTQEVIILDVREQDEYDSGHIPGAVLLPVGTIDEDTAAEITGILRSCAHKMEKCVVVVTHSRELARKADCVLRLKKGVVSQEDVGSSVVGSTSRRNAPRGRSRS